MLRLLRRRMYPLGVFRRLGDDSDCLCHRLEMKRLRDDHRRRGFVRIYYCCCLVRLESLCVRKIDKFRD